MNDRYIVSGGFVYDSKAERSIDLFLTARKLNELTAKVEALERKLIGVQKDEITLIDMLRMTTKENKRLLALIKSIPCSCFEGAHTKRCFKSKARMEPPTND